MGGVEEAWYRTGAAGQACSGSRAQVWENQELRLGEGQHGVICLCLHAQAPEQGSETVAVAAAWYWTGVEEDACLSSLDQAWEHQALTVGEYQHGESCLCLSPQVEELKAPEKGWHQTVVKVGACYHPVGTRLGEAGGRMSHSV